MNFNNKFFTEERVALLVRWWAVGAVYFFVGWGTGVAQMGTIDFVFYLGLSIGLANSFVVEPLLRKMFNLKSNRGYMETTINQKVITRLSGIFKAMFIVLIMAFVYSGINMLLISLFSFPESSVPFPGEPITFAIIYLLLVGTFNKIVRTIQSKIRK